MYQLSKKQVLWLLPIIAVYSFFPIFFFSLPHVEANYISCGSDNVGQVACGHQVDQGGTVDNAGYVCEHRKIGPQASADSWRWQATGDTCGEGEVCVISGGKLMCHPRDADTVTREGEGDCTSAQEEDQTCGNPTTGANPNSIHTCEERGTTPSGTKVYSWNITESCGSDRICKVSGNIAECDEIDSDDVVPPSQTNGDSGDLVPRGPTGPPPDAPPPPELDGMWEIIARGFNFFLGLIVVAVAAMFVYGAYMWMFSMGEPENVKRAQGILTWAVVGLVFYMIMRLILGFLLNLLGIDGLPGVTI